MLPQWRIKSDVSAVRMANETMASKARVKKGPRDYTRCVDGRCSGTLFGARASARRVDGDNYRLRLGTCLIAGEKTAKQ